MDIKLNYIEKGMGFPLILLHGNGENLSYFKHQIEYFSNKYRVIAIDTRGHGDSKRGSAPFRIHQFAQDLHDFMEEMQIDKAHLLGFSDGGNIALVFTLKYQQKVERLILNGANLNQRGVKAKIQIPIVIGYYIASMFAKRSEEAKRKSEMLGLMVNDPNIPVTELSKITVPTLVIAGTNDMIKEKHTRMIQEHMKDSKLKLLEGDHFIANQKYTEFNKAVEGFLEER